MYHNLAEPVRKALKEIGFLEPTSPQTQAIPPILNGEDVLLIAPTGSGKTEAVLLPIFSNFVQQEEKKGISILYVTPLRALNRDMVRRLSFWAKNLGIAVEVRHGDTEVKIRRRQALRPPSMLVTTPETLQAILPGTRMLQHLSHVRYVVIDEVHELATEKRGVQLAVALERLLELTKQKFQRVGLSATVGTPEKVAGFVAGTSRPIKIINVSLLKGYSYSVECPTPNEFDFELAEKLRTAPEAAARIRRILDLVKTHTSTLVFVNSRTHAEMLGHKLGQLTSDIAVHHGSLSKGERSLIEDQFKAKTLKAIVCTSTLELGIDIGHVDLVIQYMSPRQVSSLIQRVGRSGHRLELVSRGIIITVFPDDTMEAIAAVKNAYSERLEPIRIHENALDVLAHQIAGILLDKQSISIHQIHEILRRAYPYRELTNEMLLRVVQYLDKLGEAYLEGDTLKKTHRTSKYYYENLSMIPDERRYPIIDVLSDRTIGTVGDEFMALRARIGLNIIIRGKVWRIVQIEDETGNVYVVPSEDPMAAIPGWDGEILPVPYTLAQEVGRLRAEVADRLKKEDNVRLVAEKLAGRLTTDVETLLKTVEEIDKHIKTGATVPTHNEILIEAFDKYIVVHACFGERVNRTLGAIFDTILSGDEFITGWRNDGYHILIETPRKVEQYDLERLPSLLFGLTGERVESAFQEYLQARFPFAYKMKFVAERFGALPRGKTMGPESLSQLPRRFDRTPVREETIREALSEKVDIATTEQIMGEVRIGKIGIATFLCRERPTPLGFHILAEYAEIPELMAPEGVLLSNIDRMKRAIQARHPLLVCLSCGEYSNERRIGELPEKVICEKCGASLISQLRSGQDPKMIRDIFQQRLRGEEITPEELEQLTWVKRTADLILSYGKKALIAFQVKGVGPETAFRILGRMHPKEDDFYMDLLKAKIQFLRTRPYWEKRGKTS